MRQTPEPWDQPVQPPELDGAGAELNQTPDPPKLEEQCPEAMEYVSQLIARMKGADATPDALKSAEPKRALRAFVPTTTKSEAQPASVALPAPATPLPTVVPQTPPPSSATPPQINPTNRSARNPEKSTDLHRLREAANLSANSILHDYEFHNTTRKAYTDLAMAVVSMATSLVLVSLSHRVVSVAYGCALLTLAQAACSTWRFLWRTDSLRKTASDHSVCAQET
jgi:hypothetical protein